MRGVLRYVPIVRALINQVAGDEHRDRAGDEQACEATDKPAGEASDDSPSPVIRARQRGACDHAGQGSDGDCSFEVVLSLFEADLVHVGAIEAVLTAAELRLAEEEIVGRAGEEAANVAIPRRPDIDLLIVSESADAVPVIVAVRRRDDSGRRSLR